MSTKVIDSHLHVWASEKEASSFPYADGKDPPDSLQNAASISALLKQMDNDGVDGALIVQPINHKFDHSYVTHAIQTHPTRFKGMLLHDPSLNAVEAVSQLEDLALQGYVGVRFNPYLWPKSETGGWEKMSEGAGLSVYKRCGELHMPVGVMCFQGFHLHYEDIVALLKASPKTTLILDHFGFTSLTPEGDAAFEQLLKLVDYSQVIVKISALFRLQDPSPYDRVRRERFEPLLAAFGPDRLMYGSDFPYVLEQPESYWEMLMLVQTWVGKKESTRAALFHGTAERIFGPWGTVSPKSSQLL
jgi:predicted TIM-barrel fold metal-dependent hydrolase